MARTFVALMVVCGVLTWLEVIHWEATLTAGIAFFMGWMCDMTKEERERLRRNAPADRPGLQ